MNTKESLIGLNMTGMMSEKFHKLSQEIGSAEEIIKKEPYRSQAKDIDIEGELKLAEKEGVKICTLLDDNYPLSLKNIYAPPPVLYVKGEIKDIDKLSISIVGCRKASSYGKMMAEKIGGELASKGITVVSGMARGIDTKAHEGCLASYGRTIAVLGNGLSGCYPPENRKLMNRISKNGAVVSEFPMGMGPTAHNFPRRNRIISGLSLGTVVIEAPERSGALITANFALEQGREVFAVPGNISSINSRGTNKLIKAGAKLVENIDDIIEEVVPELLEKENIQDNIKESSMTRLPEEHKKVYELIRAEPVHIDEIIQRSGVVINQLSSILLDMELKGLIKQSTGKMFVRGI